MRNYGRGFTMRKADAPPPKGDWFRIENKDSSKAKVYIYDEIGYWGTTASDFASQLNELEVDEIELHINSPGGEVYDGLAIYTSLKQHPAKVTTFVDALAASAASFIALAGDEVIMSRNATMMIHDAIGLTYGNAADMRYTAELLDKVSDNIADIYAFNTDDEEKDAGFWRNLMKEEVWYSAFEAKEAGLATKVLDDDNKEAEAETNKWDLGAVFNHAGRAQAPAPLAVLTKLQVTNRSKETRMTSTPTEGTPAGEGSTSGPNTEAQPTGTGTGDEAAVESTPAAVPSPAGETGQPENKAGTVPVVVNGATFQVPAAVASHVTSLETFRSETIIDSRVDFVRGLAASNKIAASQIGSKKDGDTPASGLVAFALSLNDEQFANWKASWDAAPASSLFGQHGVGPGDAGRPANGDQSSGDIAAEIASLEQIVADHRRTGMSQEKIESKASYQRLQMLKSQLNPT